MLIKQHYNNHTVKMNKVSKIDFKRICITNFVCSHYTKWLVTKFSFTNSYKEYHLKDGLLILQKENNGQRIKISILNS